MLAAVNQNPNHSSSMMDNGKPMAPKIKKA